MAVVNLTAREFRSRQAHAFDMADNGERVIVSRKDKSYIIIPVSDEDFEISSSLMAKIAKAREEHANGQTLQFDDASAMNTWLESL